ncbi:glycoside hydrolase family 97 protein [Pinibacter soli]|uniref:Glycoside hydrolase family 97 catalytic domain-containing protein n=1 Tax=Pinibacter soli TaxID=3044211 RepID=A0ABT6RE70_9BACT|nr:glycoside hydrolase family 97 protein [Pinibacter soli]MDI3320847.1 glycoside hydrolase family 97 catalytic domain-containing protein [Pinibacter soli]
MNFFLKRLLICFLCTVKCFAVLYGQLVPHSVTITSPDKKLKVAVNETDDNVVYSFIANGQQLIRQSVIGLDGVGKFHWLQSSLKHVKQTWKPVWGKRAIVPDDYNEALFNGALYKIRIRVYNDGFAFKYEGTDTEKELTQFNFAGNYTAWYYNGENRNIGPEKLKDANGIRMPVMTIKADSNHYMAIHEANLESGEPLLLKANQGTTNFTICSKRANAWRVVLFGNTPGKMVDSHLIELLNPEPAKNLDFSWVKPGVAVWDWRINGAEANGFKYEMSLPSWKRMVDFADDNNIKSLVLDADWYGPEFSKGSDPLKGGKIEQVHQLLNYAKAKGIGIWLYLNDVGGKTYPLDQTIKQYGQWGAAGLKYGFMNGSPEEKNKHTQLITKLCAENKLLVDFHDGPVHPYGQMRTWPNAVTREYCHAQLDAHRVFQPSTFVTAVYVNMLAGPLDMSNGVVDMMQKGRVDNPTPVPSTITAEAARTLIVFSGATIIPDIPENYLKHPQILKFIRAEQMPWKETKTIIGEIGEYIVMARKSADNKWLIAAATNEEARTLSIPLSIIDKGQYKATIIEDGKDADFRTNKESYIVTNPTVSYGQEITVHLAPGGGACVLLEKTK